MSRGERLFLNSLRVVISAFAGFALYAIKFYITTGDLKETSICILVSSVFVPWFFFLRHRYRALQEDRERDADRNGKGHSKMSDLF